MFIKKIVSRVVIFIIVFSSVFFLIRYFNLLPSAKLYMNIDSIPWLFSAISLIFSILSGFVIQFEWQNWNSLIDGMHEELNALKQLSIMSNHFPKAIRNQIIEHLTKYLKLIIKEFDTKQNLEKRSAGVEEALYALEEFVLDINYQEHPQIGQMTFDLMRNIVYYREKRLQTLAHKLPVGVKMFMFCATYSVIFSSLFIGVNTLLYDYMFTLLIALLSYGIYLLIDDMSNPYSPGQWHINSHEYEAMYQYIIKKFSDQAA